MSQTLRGTSLVVATLTVAALTLLAVVIGSRAVVGASDVDTAALPVDDASHDVLAQDEDGEETESDADETPGAVDDAVLSEATITYELVLGRDPFESIRPEPEPEPIPDTPGVPTDPTLPGVPADPDDPTRPTDPADPTRPADPSDPSRPTDPADPSRPGDPSAPDSVCTDEVDGVCEGKRLELIEIFDDSARLRVEATTYDVDEGDRFAEDFVLLEVDGNCVTVLFADGDETERFRLCESSTAK